MVILQRSLIQLGVKVAKSELLSKHTAVRTIFSSKQIREGDSLPTEKNLVEGDPKNPKISTTDVFGVNRGVLFGVPGAFTPGCSSKHVPSYIRLHPEFVKKGVEAIACVSVNDPFVMMAWANDLKTHGKIRMLADPCCKFTKSIRMDKDFTELLGSIRSKRYAMIINKGKITKMFVEPDGMGVTCTMADNVLKAIKDEVDC